MELGNIINIIMINHILNARLNNQLNANSLSRSGGGIQYGSENGEQNLKAL